MPLTERDTQPQRRNKKNMMGGMLEQSGVESQMLSLSVLFTRRFHLWDVPERLTLLETTTVMCELKRRVSHSMNSTCKNRPEVLQGEELSYRRRAATEFSICLWFACEAKAPHCDCCSPNARKVHDTNVRTRALLLCGYEVWREQWCWEQYSATGQACRLS